MWEIESNSVGNGSEQGTVRPGQCGFVGNPPRGPDKTAQFASTKLLLTEVFNRIQGGLDSIPTQVGPILELLGPVGSAPPTLIVRRARRSRCRHRCGGSIASLRRVAEGLDRDSQ